MPTGPFWPHELWTNPALPDTISINQQTAYAVAALAYICISYRARKLSEPPLMVIDESDEGEEWIEDHPLNPLLDEPSPDHTLRQIYELTSIYRDMSGGCIWVKTRDNGGDTKRIQPFPRDQYIVESSNDRLYAEFRVNTRSGEIELDPEDVVHFANPLDVAPLQVALSWLNISHELRDLISKTLKTGLYPPGVLAVKEKLEDREWERAKGELIESFRSGNPFLADGGAQWQQTSIQIPDTAPADTWAIIEATVCSIFQLHPSMLGLKTGVENSPWSNLEQAQRMIYDEMAIPRWRSDEEIITRQLLRDSDQDISHLMRFDTSEVPALAEDRKKDADVVKAVGPYLRVDEARQLMGYQPLGGDLGDTLFVPGQWFPAQMIVGNGVDGMVTTEGGGERQPETEE